MATDKAMLGIYEHISELERKFDEKDAMIDWLAAKCACNIPEYFDGFVTKEEWRKAAQ